MTLNRRYTGGHPPELHARRCVNPPLTRLAESFPEPLGVPVDVLDRVQEHHPALAAGRQRGHVPVNEHRQTTQALLGANARLAEAVEEQGKALEGVRQLLSSQGYTLPPLNAPQ
jgi:hypothetical protein